MNINQEALRAVHRHLVFLNGRTMISFVDFYAVLPFHIWPSDSNQQSALPHYCLSSLVLVTHFYLSAKTHPPSSQRLLGGVKPQKLKDKEH